MDQVCARQIHTAMDVTGHRISCPREVKKSRLVRPLWSLEVIQGLPRVQGQARRRSGGGDYAGRQGAGGKGMNHRSRRNGFTDRVMDCASQAGNHGNAREERCGDGENNGLAHIR